LRPLEIVNSDSGQWGVTSSMLCIRDAPLYGVHLVACQLGFPKDCAVLRTSRRTFLEGFAGSLFRDWQLLSKPPQLFR
jgi:hypothetical protein